MKDLKDPIYKSDITATPVVKDVYREEILEEANNIASTENNTNKAAEDYVKPPAADEEEEESIFSKLFNVGKKAGTDAFKSETGQDANELFNDKDHSNEKELLQSAVEGKISIDDLNDKSKENLLKTRTGDKDTDNVLISLGHGEDIYKKIEKSDPLDAKKTMKLADSLAGNEELIEGLDLQREYEVYKSFSDTLKKYKIPQLIDKVIDKIKDIKLKESLWDENAIDAARDGDIDSVKYWVDKMGPRRYVPIADTLIRELLRSFRLSRTDIPTYREAGSKMLGLFTLLNSNWDRNPNNPSITHMDYYTYSSHDSVKALLTTDRAKYAVFGRALRIETVTTTASRAFPKIISWEFNR